MNTIQGQGLNLKNYSSNGNVAFSNLNLDISGPKQDLPSALKIIVLKLKLLMHVS